MQLQISSKNALQESQSHHVYYFTLLRLRVTLCLLLCFKAHLADLSPVSWTDSQAFSTLLVRSRIWELKDIYYLGKHQNLLQALQKEAKTQVPTECFQRLLTICFIFLKQLLRGSTWKQYSVFLEMSSKKIITAGITKEIRHDRAWYCLRCLHFLHYKQTFNTKITVSLVWYRKKVLLLLIRVADWGSWVIYSTVYHK